jgi:tRNA dimethylallyltransferase
VARTTGRPISQEWRWGAGAERKAGLRPWGLAWERQELYRRIDRRVEAMVSEGLFEEAERLRARTPPLSRSASQSIGYKEIWGALQEGRPRHEVVAAIQQATRRFAKRQLTWLRKMPIRWIPVDAETDPREVARTIVRETSIDS